MPRAHNLKDARGLTPLQARFVEEYPKDMCAAKAARRAGYKETTARITAAGLLQLPQIQAALAGVLAERSERTKITADMVLQRWWEIATANPNDLIQYRRTCCRFCHGVEHGFQWKDEAEWSRAVISAQATATETKPADIPSNAGGYGFDALLDPVSGCPECSGEGVGDVHANDTRKLSGAAAKLYAGVKVSRSGLEVLTQDQGKALENVARHLGMFKDKVELSGGLSVYEGMTPEQKRERAVSLAKELGLAGVARRD